MIYKTEYASPIGKITLAAKDDSLIALWIKGQKAYSAKPNGEIKDDESNPVLKNTMQWLDRYFNGENPPISGLKLSPDGSDFAKSVWNILLEIPYGETTTYGAVAKRLSLQSKSGRMSAQAVGGAVGSNPISIIIPCHRVIGANGSLTGYAGGIDLKIKLLKHENAMKKEFFIPQKTCINIYVNTL